MTTLTRMTLASALMLALAGGLAAQEPTATETAAETAAGASAAEPTETSTDPAPAGEEAKDSASPEMLQETRSQFMRVVERHPPELAAVLALDPTLLSNEAFIGRYPDLESFLQAHPVVQRNPHYYVRNFHNTDEKYEPSAFERAVEMLTIAFVFALSLFAVTWLVRTVIEQRRWNQLSRRQADVHNRILDRFGSSEELLAYVRSSAGTKFLESAPIAVHAEPQSRGPVARMLWSVQFGIIAATAGLGVLVVSSRFAGETAEGFFAMGAITLCVGIGFILAALVSVFISRRLGRWDAPSVPPGAVDEAGLMR